MSKVALITGITGQDGAYLAELLLAKGYEVHGVKRRASSFNTARIDHLYQDPHDARRALLPALRRPHRRHQPDPHRAGGAARRDLQPGRPEPRQGQLRDARIHRQRRRHRHAAPARGDPHPQARGPHPLLPGQHLRALRRPPPPPQSETTPFLPQSPYAAAKLYAYWITRNYRDGYGLFASNGILFNHESPLRGETFVTRKITRAVAAIELGLQDRLWIGNLDARRDWGHARDYVEGMWRILQHDRADDWVLATGEAHSVREFVERAFAEVGRELVWKGQGLGEKGIDRRTGKLLVEIDPRYFRPLEVDHLLGDPSKARAELGWRHRTELRGAGRPRWSRPTSSRSARAPGPRPARHHAAE